MRDDPVVVALVDGVRDGDAAAWDELVARYAPLVWSICLRFHFNEVDAHDVGQTVWLRLIEYLPRLRDPAALPGWIAITTRNECLRLVRLEKRDQDATQLSATNLLSTPETVDERLLIAERNAALRTAFGQLAAPCQRLLNALLVDPPRSYASIADELGMPTGSVGPRRARCLEKLRRSPALAPLVAATKTDDRSGPSAQSPARGEERAHG